MKKILCLLLCAAAVCWNTAPAFALENGADDERSFYADDDEYGGGEGDPAPPPPDDSSGSSEPAPESSRDESASSPQESGSSGESSSRDSSSSGESSSQDSGTPAPPPAPAATPGLTVDPAAKVTVVDLTKFASVSFSLDTAVFVTRDGQTVSQSNDNGKLNAAGYLLSGAQNDTKITVNGFAAPLTIGAAGAPVPVTYALSGDISAAALTVNGNLKLSRDTLFAGTAAVSGIIDAGGFKTTLTGNLTAAQMINTPAVSVTAGASRLDTLNTGTLTVAAGSLASGSAIEASGPVSVTGGTLGQIGRLHTSGNLTVSGGTVNASGTVAADGSVSVTAPSVMGPVLTAKQLTAGGTMNIGSNALVNAVSAGGDLSVSGALTAKALDVTYAGQAVSGGRIDVNGTLITDGIAEAKNGMTISGNAKAGGLQTKNGPLAISGTASVNGQVRTIGGGDILISGRLTENGGLTSAGRLTVAEGALLDGGGSIKAASCDLKGSVKGKDLTSASDLVLPGSVNLSGTLSAPNISVSGPVKAGAVGASGTVSVDSRLRSAVSLTAGTVSANKLTATGALNLPNTKLDIKGGGVDVKGAFKASGGTVTGPITADSVTAGAMTARDITAANGDIRFTGPVTAGSVVSAKGGISARDLTLSGGLKAYRDIALSGPFHGSSITSEYGGISTSSGAPIRRASVIEATRGSVSLGADTAASGRIYGKNGITMNGGSCDSIYADGPVTLKGTVRTGRIDAGALNVSGTVTASAVTCSSGTVDDRASLKCDTVKSSGKLTVRGSITADSVRGNPVTTPSGGAIHAPTVNGMENGYKGKLTITTPFGSGKNIYVELKRSGESANGFHVTTDKNGKVSFTGLASGTYSVYAESGSSSRRGTVSVSSSGTSTLDLRSSAGSNGSGGTNGGRDPFDEDEFWDGVYDDIRSARRGETVRVSASKADSVPVWLLKELEGRPITLKLTHGRYSITIDGDNMYEIPGNRVFYRFDDLADLYKFPPDDASGSSSSSSSASSSQSAGSSSSSQDGTTAAPLPAPPAYVPPAAPVVPAVPPASAPSADEEESSGESGGEEESSSEDSEDEESSAPEDEPEEPEEPEDRPAEADKGAGMLPVIVAVVLIMVSLGGIAVGYVLYRRSRESGSIYDDDGE